MAPPHVVRWRMTSLSTTAGGQGIDRGTDGVGSEGVTYMSDAGEEPGTSPETCADPGAIIEILPATSKTASLRKVGLGPFRREIISLASKQLFESIDGDEHDNDKEGGAEGKTDEALLSPVSATAAASYDSSSMGVFPPALKRDVAATTNVLNSNKVLSLAASRGKNDVDEEAISCIDDPRVLEIAMNSALCQPVDTGFGSTCSSVSGSRGNHRRTQHDPHSLDPTPHAQSRSQMQELSTRGTQFQLQGVVGESCVIFDLPSATRTNVATEGWRQGGREHGEITRGVVTEKAREGSVERYGDEVGGGEDGEREVTSASSSLSRATYIPSLISKNTDRQASATTSMIRGDVLSGEPPAVAVSKAGQCSGTTRPNSVRTVTAKFEDCPPISLSRSPVRCRGLPIGVRGKSPIVESQGVERERPNMQGWKAGQDERVATLETAISKARAALPLHAFEEVSPAITDSTAAITQSSLPSGLLIAGWAGSDSTCIGSCDIPVRGALPVKSNDAMIGADHIVTAASTGLRSAVNGDTAISGVSETAENSKGTAGEAVAVATISSPASPASVGGLPSQSPGFRSGESEAAGAMGQVFTLSTPCLASRMETCLSVDLEGSGDTPASRSTTFAQRFLATGDSAYGPSPSSAVTAANPSVARSKQAEARAVGEGGGRQVGPLHQYIAPRDLPSRTGSRSGFFLEPTGSITGGTSITANFTSVTSVPSPSRVIPESNELLDFYQNDGGGKRRGVGSRDRSMTLSGLESAGHSGNPRPPTKDKGLTGNSCVGVLSDAGISAWTSPPRGENQLEVGGDDEEAFVTHLEPRSEYDAMTVQTPADRRALEGNREDDSSEDERYKCSVRI